jgi:hypothetical protein
MEGCLILLPRLRDQNEKEGATLQRFNASTL